MFIIARIVPAMLTRSCGSHSTTAILAGDITDPFSDYRAPTAVLGDERCCRCTRARIKRGTMADFETTEWIWHNGEIIPWGDATLHVMSHVIHYGSSVFEGIRCYRTA